MQGEDTDVHRPGMRKFNMGEQMCWCDHLERWHSVAGICRWCAKMELRCPQFNFMPRHPSATEMPEELRRQVLQYSMDRVLER